MTLKFEFAGTREAERGLGGVILWLTYKQWTDVQASGKGGCHLRGKNDKKRAIFFFTLLLFLPLCCVIFAKFILDCCFFPSSFVFFYFFRATCHFIERV